ncbi:transcriptional regulator [Dehalococcoidia bacterium]|nr:transcriptional regulator [Dehalococcoidia bacterium]
MAMTRDFKKTVKERAQGDSEFSIALLDEAISLFLNGEPEVARLVLRDLVNATVGFEELAVEVAKPNKSLHRMLSAKGNPTMDNLTTILKVLRQKLDVDIEVHTVPCH